MRTGNPGELTMMTPAFPVQSEAGARRRALFFPGLVGFFFVFRNCLTFLFFQKDPVTGTAVIIAIDLALLCGTIFYSAQARLPIWQNAFAATPVRWLLVFLGFSLASVSWTGAQSAAVAFAYWSAMASDVVIVFLLLRKDNPERWAEALMKGAVWGAAALSAIAWCTPATEDLRLGDLVFLHPNTLGLEIGVATLLAQYLATQAARWKWLSIFLAITLLRTLSKTAIAAFVVAECWYLLRSRSMSRKTKVWIGAGVLAVIGSFWSLLSAYVDVYNNTASGEQVETLTGRTFIWAVAFAMGIEKPWLGHGVFSFKSLVPPFGSFQAQHAHNEFLQQFFEYGAVGVVIVAGLYWSIYRLARRAPSSDLRTLALTLLIFALVHGLADTINFGLSYPLWILATLSICLTASARVSGGLS
jgi:exopolysaccharide production protein ExoQ